MINHHKNYHFVASDVRVDEVSTLFQRHALLEAVLVTANGTETEELLGIATRWDMLHFA
jgi:CBS domain-containing protein